MSMKESCIISDFVISIYYFEDSENSALTSYSVKIKKILESRYSLRLTNCTFEKFVKWLKNIKTNQFQYPETSCECGSCDIKRFIFTPNIVIFESSFNNNKSFVISEDCRSEILKLYKSILRRLKKKNQSKNESAQRSNVLRNE